MRSRTKESKLTLHAVVVFWLKQTKQRKHRVGTPSIPSRERTTPREPKFHTIGKVIFLAAHMSGSPRPRAGGMLLGSTSQRITPSESLASLHEVAKCLTMELAVYLAKEVAAILRAVLTHETKKLYNDSTVHLLCSNCWIQPIYVKFRFSRCSSLL